MTSKEIVTSYSKEEYERDLELARTVTADYFSKLATGLIEPGRGIISGLQAPLTTNECTTIYEVSGTGVVKLNSSTDNVVAFFDPEASLRSGQMQIVVIEKTGTTGVAVTTVNVGRPAVDFGSAGVVASSFEARNMSAFNLCSGSQTHAVLFSHPALMGGFTQSTLAQSVYNRTRDVLTIQSSVDGSKSVALTNHLGDKMTTTYGKTISREARSLYSLESSTATGFPELNATFFSGPILLAAAAEASRTFFTSSAISSSATGLLANPFRFDTRSIRVYIKVSMSDPTVPVPGNNQCNVLLRTLNEAGQIINTYSTFCSLTNAAGVIPVIYQLEAEFRINEESQPIANIVVLYDGYSPSNDANATVLSEHVFIETSSETADIPDRPIHIVRFEGVNQGASLAFAADVAVAGAPSSDNMFIASGKREPHSNLDIQMVRTGLLELYASLDRVSTTSGHAFIGSMLSASQKAIAENVIHSNGKLSAFSFKGMGRTLRKIADTVKDARHTGSEMLKRALPVLEVYGATGLPGSQYAELGVKGIKGAQKVGILEALDSMY